MNFAKDLHETIQDHIDVWVKKNHRTAINPMFRGTIMGVVPGSYGNPNGPGYMVQVLRTNDSFSDGCTFFCIANGYVPQVGDDVELIWRDRWTAYALICLNRASGAAGSLGYAQVVADQGTFTAVTDLTNLTVTVNVGAKRRIRVRGFCQFRSSVANDIASLLIREGATQLQASNVGLSVINQNYSIDSEVIILPTAGSHIYKLSGIRAVGTGNITMGAQPTFPAFIVAEDIGI